MAKKGRTMDPPNPQLFFNDLDSRFTYLVFHRMEYPELTGLLPRLRSCGLEVAEEAWVPDQADRREGTGRLVLKLDGNTFQAYLFGERNSEEAAGRPLNDPVETGRRFARRPPMSSIPTADGWRMPAEWEPHAGCWMAWPCREGLWGDYMARAKEAYALLARTIADFEPVTMLARPEHVDQAARLCGNRVTLMPLDIDDSWTRDTGPTFLSGPAGVAGVDWIFNGYGNIYTDHLLDNIMAQAILDRLGLKRYAAPLVMEGSAFHVDGEGTLITTEECLLNPNRNPGFTRGEIENFLVDYLGVSTIIWLGQGLEDDESSGHVSNVACFSRPGQVLVAAGRDPSDNNYWIAQDNIARLRNAVDARGRNLDIVELPLPTPRLGRRGRRMPLSYINFYMPNNAVIIPAFDDPADTPARLMLESLFPHRRVVQIPALDIVRGGGGIHCITQQQPGPKSQVSAADHRQPSDRFKE